MSEVILNEGENIDRAVRLFKKRVEKAGIIAELRKKRHYEKPSERRKRKEKQARSGKRAR